MSARRYKICDVSSSIHARVSWFMSIAQLIEQLMEENMIIDTSIVERYFSDEPIENIQQHWIFDSIIEGKHVFEEPKNDLRDMLKAVYDILLDELKEFRPINPILWEQFFGISSIPANIIVYIIIGSPSPYDAMVRVDELGNPSVILDIARIYYAANNKDMVADICKRFITHEVSHIIVQDKYVLPTIADPLYDNLKYVVFDEGIAHFLSYAQDVLSVDWYSDYMMERRSKAYAALLNAIRENNENKKLEILNKANSGQYWNKFGAISGLFAIIDYYNNNNRNMCSFKDIFDNGPDMLVESIKVRSSKTLEVDTCGIL